MSGAAVGVVTGTEERGRCTLAASERSISFRCVPNWGFTEVAAIAKNASASIVEF